MPIVPAKVKAKGTYPKIDEACEDNRQQTPLARIPVRLRETICVPARSEVLCIGKQRRSLFDSNAIKTSRHILLESADIPIQGICGARILTNEREDLEVQIRLANITTQPITLQAKMIVGFVEQVDLPEDQNKATKSHAAICAIIDRQNQKHDSAPTSLTGQERFDKLAEILQLNHLSTEQRAEIWPLIKDYAHVFYLENDKLGHYPHVKHRILVPPGTPPIRQRMYRLPHSQTQTVKDEISKLLAQGVIRESTSSWSSPLLLVSKRVAEGAKPEVRMCIDFRLLNQLVPLDKFPLPHIQDIFDSIGTSSIFSVLDIKAAYHQIDLHEEDKQFTAFTSRDGLYEFNQLVFGLSNAVPTWSRVIQAVLTGLPHLTAQAYLDDLLIFANTLPEHMIKLRAVLERLEAANLKLNPGKCSFLKPEVEYLGHVIGNGVLKTHPRNTNAIKHFPRPTTVKTLKSWMGLAVYYKKFLDHFSDTVKPLNKLLCKGEPFVWTDEQEIAFNTLKRQLTSDPVLIFPRLDQRFYLKVDTSEVATGSILAQLVGDQLLPVSYASRQLQPRETRYHASERELLGIVYAMKYHHCYLLGREFTLISDSTCALQWLKSVKNPTSRQFRWVLALSDYKYTVQHFRGTAIPDVDCLSRTPAPGAIEPEVPSGGAEFQSPTPRAVTRGSAKLEPHSSKVPALSAQIKTITSQGAEFEPVWDDQQIKESQGQDKDLKPIIDRLLQDNLGDPEYTLDARGILFKLNSKRHAENRMVCPKAMTQKVLSSYHDLPYAAAHAGLHRTYTMISKRFFWINMYVECSNYVKHCFICQKSRRITKQDRAPLTIWENAPSETFSVISIDLVGPMLKTNAGNKYLLTIICVFSKFVTIVPLKETSTKTIAQALLDHWIFQYGAPKVIVSDRGTQFLSKLFARLSSSLKIKRMATTSYHAAGNPIERHHGTISSIVKKYVQDGAQWDDMMIMTQFTMRSAVSRSTGMSPNFIVYGKDLVIPFEADIHFHETSAPQDTHEYIAELKDKLANIHSTAHANIRTAAEKTQEYYNKKSKPVTIK
ncbi:RNase H-like domain-containing protein, partial [Undibacterium sp.]|uniref:RNase H-like domain-containing protein n=1 Tax=Undibacterium sp. TaxID=1914977 RepID=UPI00374FE5AD